MPTGIGVLFEKLSVALSLQVSPFFMAISIPIVSKVILLLVALPKAIHLHIHDGVRLCSSYVIIILYPANYQHEGVAEIFRIVLHASNSLPSICKFFFAFLPIVTLSNVAIAIVDGMYCLTTILPC